MQSLCNGTIQLAKKVVKTLDMRSGILFPATKSPSSENHSLQGRFPQTGVLVELIAPLLLGADQLPCMCRKSLFAWLPGRFLLLVSTCQQCFLDVNSISVNINGKIRICAACTPPNFAWAKFINMRLATLIGRTTVRGNTNRPRNFRTHCAVIFLNHREINFTWDPGHACLQRP